MTPERVIRLLHHKARACHDKDTHEALCLILPAALKILDLAPMDDYEAAAAWYQLKQELINHDAPPPIAK